jgi:hypothetical protein
MKQELARAKAEVIPARGHRLPLGRARSQASAALDV